MKYQLPEKIKKLKPYDPIEGDYEIRVDANESFFNLNQIQLKHLETQLETLRYNRYPDPYAKKLCQAFADFYGLDPQLVTAGNGSDELIGLLCGAFCGPDDKVGVFEQDFSMYRIDCEIYSVACVTLPKREDLTIDVEETIRQIDEQGISVLIFSNPCNPTSLGLSREDVRRLITGTGALVVLDEAYMDFWNQSMLEEVEEYENLIILRTCSKAIGLAGIRVGFAVANQRLSQALKGAKPPYNVNILSQLYGEVTLSDKEYLNRALNAICEETARLNKKLEDLSQRYPVLEKVYPSCTNFVYVKTEKSREIFENLLKRSIAVRLMGGYLRISCGSGIENEIVLKNLEEVLQELS
ncbi:MAG: pyridoxal phosphate-dependent aminotransferase [Massiliimalia sp.]